MWGGERGIAKEIYKQIPNFQELRKSNDTPAVTDRPKNYRQLRQKWGGGGYDTTHSLLRHATNLIMLTRLQCSGGILRKIRGHWG